MGEKVHRSYNGLKTAALLGLLTSIILLIGWAFGGSTGLIIAFVVALAMNGVSYFYSDKIALRSMGARPVSEQEAPRLYAMVRSLAQQAGQPMPRLYVSPTAQPNAFATGRNPKNAAVCVTEDIVAMLNERDQRDETGERAGHRRDQDVAVVDVRELVPQDAAQLALVEQPQDPVRAAHRGVPRVASGGERVRRRGR